MLSMSRPLALLLLLACQVNAAWAQHVATPQSGPQTILHLLDYVSVEYPQFVQAGKVVNPGEYAEQVEFAGQIKELVAALPADPKRETFVRQAEQLLALINAKGDGAEVAVLAHRLQQDLITAYRIPVAPKQAPDLAPAAALYTARCAACHGSSGDGAGPQAAKLEPRPSDFRDGKRQSARSVFALFNTITLGVDGTAMTAFSDLSAEERWRLAFYVSQFAADDAQRERGVRAWERGEGRALFSSLPRL